MSRRKRFGKIRIAAVVAIAALIVAAVLVWHHKTSPYHFLAVKEGVLYRSGTLRPGNLRNVIDRYGIRTVVNLRSRVENAQEWHKVEAKVCAEKSVALVDLPMKHEAPPDAEQIETWLKLLNTPSALPILVHCQHGVVRTGMLVAVYEIESGKGNEETWESLPMFGHRRKGPHRKPMRDFILHYDPRPYRSTHNPPAPTVTSASQARNPGSLTKRPEIPHAA